MQWKKKGLIFAPSQHSSWIQSHAQVPTVDTVEEGVLRIYFGTRNDQNRTLTTYLEADAASPHKVHYVHDRPVLGLGDIGCFDDCGAMPSCIVDHDGAKLLYYTGWNTSTTVPYRNSIGVAISEDGGRTFRRHYQGPVLDRTHSEPHFCATPFVMIDDRTWHMWYLSCVGWHAVGERMEPQYHIKYAESADGVHWNRTGIVCIDSHDDAPEPEAFARPWVLKCGDAYRMWYCYRKLSDYRENRDNSYRIGYAESDDGIRWERLDGERGLDIAASGWDSQMVAYPSVYRCSDKVYMLYNGNGFGASGFGYAIADERELGIGSE
jgi:hypothetical protein